ncbi:MAG: alanine racemase [Ilumatobacteraceae bacterium]
MTTDEPTNRSQPTDESANRSRPTTHEPIRWAWAEIDTGAIAHNIAHFVHRCAPARVWAVVKANGYGHGAELSARAALAGGATGLCVALTQEGEHLRDVLGADTPETILVLSQQPAVHADRIVTAHLTPTVYTLEGVAAIAAAAARAGLDRYPVHLKVDTGMRRVGVHPEDAVALADAITSSGLHLEGVFTHLATADEPDDPNTAEQLARFDETLLALKSAGHEPDLVHAVNTAGALAFPHAHLDVVRIGIGMYGIEPGPGVAELCGDLRPAMRLAARVGHVKPVAEGDASATGCGIASTPQRRRDHPRSDAPMGVPRRLALTGGQSAHPRRAPTDPRDRDDGQIIVDVGGSRNRPCRSATRWCCSDKRAPMAWSGFGPRSGRNASTPSATRSCVGSRGGSNDSRRRPIRNRDMVGDLAGRRGPPCVT